MDLVKLKAVYATMSDEHLLKLASVERKEMEEAALEVLDAVITERGLDLQASALNSFIDQPSDEQFNAYISLIRNLPCPRCERKEEALNAMMVHTTFSVIVLTSSKSSLRIACPTCLATINRNAHYKNLILGWCGLPFGPFKTLQFLYKNIRAKKDIDNKEANDLLHAFVYSKLAEIEFRKNSNASLSELLITA